MAGLRRLADALPLDGTMQRIGVLSPYFERDDLDASDEHDGMAPVLVDSWHCGDSHTRLREPRTIVEDGPWQRGPTCCEFPPGSCAAPASFLLDSTHVLAALHVIGRIEDCARKLYGPRVPRRGDRGRGTCSGLGAWSWWTQTWWRTIRTSPGVP
jgi:hypothetical protein